MPIQRNNETIVNVANVQRGIFSTASVLLLYSFMLLLLNYPITLSLSFQLLHITILRILCYFVTITATTNTITATAAIVTYHFYHRIQFEPVFDSKRSKNILQHIILYECQGSSDKLAAMSREPGRSCYGRPSLPCNAIVAAWIRGSEVSAFIIHSFTMTYGTALRGYIIL